MAIPTPASAHPLGDTSVRGLELLSMYVRDKSWGNISGCFGRNRLVHVGVGTEECSKGLRLELLGVSERGLGAYFG